MRRATHGTAAGRSLPRPVDDLGVATLIVDEHHLELFVITLGEKDVATHREVLANVALLQRERIELRVGLLVGPPLTGQRSLDPRLTAAKGGAERRAGRAAVNERAGNRAEPRTDARAEHATGRAALERRLQFTGTTGLAGRLASRQGRHPIPGCVQGKDLTRHD